MPESLMRIILILCALLYYGAFVLTFVEKKKGSVRLPLRILHLAAVVVNVAIIGYNYLINLIENGVSYAPFVSMYQVLIFLAACFCPVYYLVDRAYGCKGYKAFFLLAPAIVMTGPCFMDIADVWHFVPALQSVFFIPHVFCYMLSYTLAAVAFLIVAMAYLKNENHDRVCYCCVRMLFPFMTVAMFLGAVWADQAWGEFWAWDIKEAWSLVTWLNYMLCLHLFRREKTKKYARILVITGCVLVVITFLFSNVLDVPSVHSY